MTATSGAVNIDKTRPSIARDGRIEDIEFLRAIAVIYTLVAHLPALMGWYGVAITHFENYFDLGSGVDLFFVISGFVITRSFLRHLGGKVPSNFLHVALPFWTRRVFRILPAAWFWIAFSIFATVFFNRSGAFGDLTANMADSVAAILQIENIHLHACIYAKTAICADGGVPNGVYWTLSLEEQFYFFFPFVMVLLPRLLLGPALIVAASIQIFSASFSAVENLAWWVRSEGLIIGVLLALASEHPLYKTFEPRFLARPIARTFTFVLFAIALGITAAPFFQFTPFGYGLLALVTGFWLFVASFGRGYAMPPGFANSITMWIGSRSYSLYLCHFSAYCATRELWFRLGHLGIDERADVRYAITAGCLLFIFAEATYQFIERPSRLKGRKIAEQLEKRFFQR